MNKMQRNRTNPPYGIFDVYYLDASTFLSGSNRQELSETFTYLFVINRSNFLINDHKDCASRNRGDVFFAMGIAQRSGSA